MEIPSAGYTVAELPLTVEDKKQMKKGKGTALIGWLFLALFFVWFSSAKVSYRPVMLICAAGCVLVPIFYAWSLNKSLANPKIVFTGKVSNKLIGEEVMIFLGSEAFDITYAKNSAGIEAGDMVSLHYSKTKQGKRGMLLKIEKTGAAS